MLDRVVVVMVVVVLVLEKDVHLVWPKKNKPQASTVSKRTSGNHDQ